jgi:coenzyme F420-reducing hydrogenase delta subunit
MISLVAFRKGVDHVIVNVLKVTKCLYFAVILELGTFVSSVNLNIV